MKKEEFYFDSRDGQHKIHAVRYMPEQEEIAGVVQIVHGMAEYVERYENFARFMTDRGFVVTGEDHLGHGGSVAQQDEYGYFCEQDPATVVVRDVHRLKKMTQKLYPSVPYVLFGHSMGSFIVRNYLFRYGSGISGAVIMGTGMQGTVKIFCGKVLAGIQRVLFGPKHISRTLNKLLSGDGNNRIPNPRTDSDWICTDEAAVDAYLADPLCGFPFTVNGFQTLFELIARVKKKENLALVPGELPVFMLSGAEDAIGDYGQGVRRACQSFLDAGIRDVQVKLYDGFRHELLNEPCKEEVMQDIYDWIKEKVHE